MPRFHNMNGKRVPFTAEEETQRDTEEAQAIIDSLDRFRNDLYGSADKEFIKRGLIIGGWSVRGGNAKDRFTAVSMKTVSRRGVLKVPLENHHDDLDTLKDIIEAAVDMTALEAIDVTDDRHWSN